LIANDEVDIVSIVTTPGLQAEMAWTTMSDGKHVLLEKAIAIIEESAELQAKILLHMSQTFQRYLDQPTRCTNDDVIFSCHLLLCTFHWLECRTSTH